ncbi:ABC transporter permease [Lacrimispora defluvii]|uniref:FtsX-like permease family protein n=1 Tax=Lacrimispora defluvii TaxID=2719233 RepID=A0ABX1VVJ8_9FIRM|nr:ABC transporter permease [Lacrimispora defluvii]NNJ31415.1 FtsX-like permease family protein [Lacrimispora defluvii]
MNILNKATLQSMKKNRTRTIVTIIGVVLSTAMITGVAAFSTSLLHFLIRSSIVKHGNWHVEFSDVDSSFIQERTDDKEISGIAAVENIGYAVLKGAKSPEKPYLFIAGFSDQAFHTLPINLISGRLPENSGEVLIPAHVAEKGGVRFRVGDTISLDVGDRVDGSRNLSQHIPFHSGAGGETLVTRLKKTYRVVGICQRPGFEEHTAPGYTLITKADGKENTNSFSLFVTLKNPRQVKAYVNHNGEKEDYLFNDYILRFMGISENRLIITLLYTVGGILVAIIMTGSVLLIYNSFHISLNERTRQFGIFASVGATGKQLRNSVLFEGLCIGVIGIPIGILAGIGSIGLILPIVAGKFKNILYSTVPLTLWVSAASIAVSAAVSLVTILISAYIPARKAAGASVMENILQTNEVKIHSKDLKISKLSRRIYGLEGTLALKNFKRNKKRYRSIVLSLVLSIVLFVSGNAFGSTLKRLLQQFMVDVDYDILFDVQDMNDSEMLPLYNRLKAADGVYKSNYQVICPYSCNIRAGDLSDQYRQYKGYTNPEEVVHIPLDLQFITDSEYLDFIHHSGLSEEEYTGPNGKMIAIAKQRNVRTNQPDEVLDLFANSSMILPITPVTEGNQKAEQNLDIDTTFVDTYPIDPPPKQSSQSQKDFCVFMVIAPYSLKEKFNFPDSPVTIGMNFQSKTPSQSVAEMESIIQSEGITSQYHLYNAYEILEQFHSLTFVTDVFTYVFVIIISLIAIANVFNTISTNIRLRRRELAMLRSIGMSERSFNKMMVFECIFYGMQALYLGLPIAGILSWLIYKGFVIAERTENFKFIFPFGSMVISALSVLFIVFITMLYAIGKIKKENIIDALRNDMT